MKKIIVLSTILLVMLFLGGGSPVFAATWTDTYSDSEGDFLMNSDNSVYSYTHNITDDESGGFVPYADIVGSYSLEISLYDYPVDNAAEKVKITIAGDELNGTYAIGDITLGWSVKGVDSLNDDGTLAITLTRQNGDFYFHKSVLEANPVPLPSALVLLGSGLVGLWGIKRKKGLRAEC
jgi:hypothetical protein